MKSSPLPVKPLFGKLDQHLLNLLTGLDPGDWERPTVARLWTVKDVAAHLLDGNLKTLSMQRDGYFGEKAPKNPNYEDLVKWLNQLNADWVKAATRLSPGVIIDLLKSTGPEVTAYFESLNDWENAVFPVSWAGEIQSYNWMHLAREYSERWHHQQQIREAVNKAGIMTREFYFPVLDTFMQALPHAFAGISSSQNTTIKVEILGDAGGVWFLTKGADKWELGRSTPNRLSAEVHLKQEWAWKLFTKSLRSRDLGEAVELKGEVFLARQVLEMVAVMA